MTIKTTDLLIPQLKSIIETADRDLNRFKEKFEVNPYHAFEWSGSAMQAAAKKDLTLVTLAVLLNEKGTGTQAERVEELLKEYQDRLLSQCRSSVSTSLSHNTMAVMNQAALSEMISFLSSWLRSFRREETKEKKMDERRNLKLCHLSKKGDVVATTTGCCTPREMIIIARDEYAQTSAKLRGKIAKAVICEADGSVFHHVFFNQN